MSNPFFRAVFVCLSLSVTAAFAEPAAVECEIHDLQADVATRGIRPFPGYYEVVAKFRDLTFLNLTSASIYPDLAKFVVFKEGQGQMNFDLPRPTAAQPARVVVQYPGFNFAIYCRASSGN